MALPSDFWLPANARSDFKKAPPPKTGPAFGNWAGRDVNSLQLPGGGLLQFDLNRLTLADYRSMRDHYQINASLTVLAFMMHRIDWHIECDNKEIAAAIEENIRRVWTRMIRAISQSYWAGFSPTVIEYENDPLARDGRGMLVISKFKDLIPEEVSVNWKDVDGYAPPGHIPPKYKIYDGIKQHGLRWPIPAENTLYYPLLMENGDYRGKKLLRPAFSSWYFSILLHLYANRYYERFGEPLPVGRAPYDDDVTIDGRTVSGREAMEDILRNLRNRSVVVLPDERTQVSDSQSAYSYDIEYLECVDEETQILTRRGWMSYDSVLESDETLTLDHVTGLASWQPILKMNVHQADNREMLRMEGTTHSSLTTLGHRWPVINNNQRSWRLSGDLKQRDRIPLIADRVDHPAEAKYEDAFVELVAWYWTEGYTFATGNYVSISQKRYPEKIRSALTRLFGPPVSGFASRPGSTALSGIPQWRENGKTNDVESRQFFLNYEATQLLHSVCPAKIPTYEFILSLTRAQLNLYIQTAMFAHGNQTDRQSFLMQKSRPMAEMFQFACIQAGYATSLYHQKPDSRFPADTGMWVTSIRRSVVLHPKNAHVARGPFEMSRVAHTGIVWCPTTANGTWLARRRGTVYFTGNSQMRGADFEKYITRLDEEITLGLFTPLLLLRGAGGGSYNLGVQQMQMYLWMLNALAGDMKEYIDYYVIDRLKNYNWGPNAPRATWEYRAMGKENGETMRAIVTELLRKDKVGVDLDELGATIGLSLKEIREITTPPGEDPPEDPTADEAGVDDRQRTERDRSRTKQRGVGEPRATQRSISARIGGQVEKAFRSGGFDSSVIRLGYRRALVDDLQEDGWPADVATSRVDGMYARLNAWLTDMVSVGADFHGGPDAFMDRFNHTLNEAFDSLVD